MGPRQVEVAGIECADHRPLTCIGAQTIRCTGRFGRVHGLPLSLGVARGHTERRSRQRGTSAPEPGKRYPGHTRTCTKRGPVQGVARAGIPRIRQRTRRAMSGRLQRGCRRRRSARTPSSRSHTGCFTAAIVHCGCAAGRLDRSVSPANPVPDPRPPHMELHGQRHQRWCPAELRLRPVCCPPKRCGRTQPTRHPRLGSRRTPGRGPAAAQGPLSWHVAAAVTGRVMLQQRVQEELRPSRIASLSRADEASGRDVDSVHPSTIAELGGARGKRLRKALSKFS
jgi:hypothetical protein